MSTNLTRGVFSSLLLVFNSLANKMVGLVSTLILARVLLPEDFGIIAIATLLVGFLEILATTGSNEYLLRSESMSDEKINTSWTINLLLKTGLSCLMLIAVPFISAFYNDPRLTPVAICLILFFITHAFQNPGMIYLQRRQQYGSIVKVKILAKILSATGAIFVALVYESYWALVVGKGINAVVMVVGTQFLYPFKRKLMLKDAREQWEFSGWVIPQAIFGYFRTQLDTLIVSTTFGAAQLGSYHTMKYIAFIPSQQFIMPIAIPFLVELAKAKNSPSYFGKQFRASFILLALLGLPICTLMYLYHFEITWLLLGDNWLDYSFLIGTFGLLIPSSILLSQSKRVLLVYGKTKQIFVYEVGAFCIVYGVLLLSGIHDIKQFSLLLVIMENIVSFSFYLFILWRYTGIKSIIDMFISLIPISIALFVGYYVSYHLVPKIDIVFFDLVLKSASFIVCFSVIISLSYVSFLHKLSEWHYLHSLALRSLVPIIKKKRKA